MPEIKKKLVELLEDLEELPCCATYEGQADYLIASGVTIQRWISVEERLPFAEYGESGDVLAVTKFGLLRTLYFDGGNWCFQSGECCPYKITHWMPMPEAPKGE